MHPMTPFSVRAPVSLMAGSGEIVDLVDEERVVARRQSLGADFRDADPKILCFALFKSPLIT